MRPVAIFRFSPTEGPGRFGEFLAERGIAVRLIALDAGEAVPGDAEPFAGIGMMGGPMSVNDPLPWIEPLCRLLRDAVARRVPVVGHCLGGQLLAKALGATVGRAREPEIGWWPVRVVGDDGPAWFGGRRAFDVYHWHFETFALPRSASPLLTGDRCANQAFVVDDRHLGFQCHPEMTEELVRRWCADGAEEIARHRGGGVQDVETMLGDLGRRVEALRPVAESLYTRWVEGLRR